MIGQKRAQAPPCNALHYYNIIIHIALKFYSLYCEDPHPTHDLEGRHYLVPSLTHSFGRCPFASAGVIGVVPTAAKRVPGYVDKVTRSHSTAHDRLQALLAFLYVCGAVRRLLESNSWTRHAHFQNPARS